jgi:hypothetical protein
VQRSGAGAGTGGKGSHSLHPVADRHPHSDLRHLLSVSPPGSQRGIAVAVASSAVQHFLGVLCLWLTKKLAGGVCGQG